MIEIINEGSNELAALVSVASLAMIGIAVAILVHYWNRFEYYRLTLSKYFWKSTLPYGLIWVLFPILAFIAYALLSIRGSDLVPDIWVPLIFGVSLLILSITVIREIIRKKVYKLTTTDSELFTFIYFVALSYMVSSVVFNVIALNGVAPTMLEITFGPFDSTDFEWGKWCSAIAISTFSLGILFFGISFFADRNAEWKGKLPKDDQK